MRLYLAGRRGAGKSTAASILARRFRAQVIKITEPLYEIASRYFGMDKKDRLLLQRVGDAFRAIDPVWLAKHAAWKADCRAGLNGRVVIDGVRTFEEAAWLNDHGWIGILITAPDTERLSRRAEEPIEADEHHTEAAVDALPVAFQIQNKGTIEEFEGALVEVVEIALGLMNGGKLQ